MFIHTIIGGCYMKNHYVYKITHIETGCFYIGMRSCKTDISIDPYLGSGIIIKRFINKYGKEKNEGLVIRIADEFYYKDFLKSVAKLVRKDHIINGDNHWRFKRLQPNKLV